MRSREISRKIGIQEVCRLHIVARPNLLSQTQHMNFVVDNNYTVLTGR